MSFERIVWIDKHVDLETGNIVKGTPLSAANLNRIEEGISEAYENMLTLDRNKEDIDMIKQNQMILLIQQDLSNKSTEMDVGYWFDSLKDNSKIDNSTMVLDASNFKMNAVNKTKTSCEFSKHDIGFVTNKITYYHSELSNNLNDYELEFVLPDQSDRSIIQINSTNVEMFERGAR